MAEREAARRAQRAGHDALERAFERALDAATVIDARVLVAVSGGRDSCVLLDLFVRVAERRRFALVVGHVHHGLRGADADRDALHVASLAKDAGLACEIVRVDPEAARRDGPSRSRPTLEEAARDLRRAALVRLADEFDCRFVATAHHAGDQAETVLLRLLRGTGPDGLAGIRPTSRDGRFVRPLLACAPESIAGWARTRELVWCEDASNVDRRFARNRVRRDLLPFLADQFNPRILRALVDLAEATGEESAWLDTLEEEAARTRIAWHPPAVHLAIAGWNALPEALARRLVRRALVQVGLARDVSRSAVMRALTFLRRERRAGRDKKVELPRGFTLRRVGDHFEIGPTG